MAPKRFRLERMPCRKLAKSLETTQENIYGPSRVQVNQLAPLRRVEILQAAKENGFDCARFNDEIDRCNAVSLAIGNHTGTALRHIRLHTSQLTSNKIKLYEVDVNTICREPSQRQRDLGLGTASEDITCRRGICRCPTILTSNRITLDDSATDSIQKDESRYENYRYYDQVECSDL
jgi:hypothetical protein